MNVFFCDVRGTFDGSEEEREKKVSEFVEAIVKLSNSLEINDLVFRFITTDTMEFLLPFVRELNKKTENTPIRLTSQFAEHQKYKNGVITNIPYDNKIDQIRYISEGRNVKRVFFADDCIQTQIIIKKVLSIVCPDTEIISFIPGNINKHNPEEQQFASEKRGIDGLIEIVTEYNNYIENHKEKEKCLVK